MTILVLSIAVPTAETVPAERLPGALRQLAPQVLVYVISFTNLGVLWVGQHNQYHFISRADRWSKTPRDLAGREPCTAAHGSDHGSAARVTGLPDSMSYPTTASTARAPLAALAIRSTTASGRET
jgi:hypothetical protein